MLVRQELRKSRIAAARWSLFLIMSAWSAYLLWTGVNLFVYKSAFVTTSQDTRSLVDWTCFFCAVVAVVLALLWLIVEINCLRAREGSSPLRTLITYTVRVYTSWVSAEVKCLRPAHHFEEASAYLESLNQRVESLMIVEQLPLSELARDRFLDLLGNLRDKLGSVASEVSFINPRVERQQRLWGTFAEPQRVTWGDLMAFEAIVERAEQLLERPVRAWSAGENVKKLVCVDPDGLRLVDPTEFQLPSDWSATERDYGASLPDAVSLVSTFEQLEGSKSGLRRLHRRANRVFRSRPARRLALATQTRMLPIRRFSAR